jgi:hypothetical protein
MMSSDPLKLQDFESAVRGVLAAAGPVEPSRSPDQAPGPTLSGSARKSRANCFANRKTQALVNQGRALHRRGENYSAIARALGVARDTARRWLDPEYAGHRRSRATPPPPGAEATMAGEPALPTLPYIPGITISGRYRMKP